MRTVVCAIILAVAALLPPGTARGDGTDLPSVPRDQATTQPETRTYSGDIYAQRDSNGPVEGDVMQAGDADRKRSTEMADDSTTESEPADEESPGDTDRDMVYDSEPIDAPASVTTQIYYYCYPDYYGYSFPDDVNYAIPEDRAIVVDSFPAYCYPSYYPIYSSYYSRYYPAYDYYYPRYRNYTAGGYPCYYPGYYRPYFSFWLNDWGGGRHHRGYRDGYRDTHRWGGDWGRLERHWNGWRQAHRDWTGYGYRQGYDSWRIARGDWGKGYPGAGAALVDSGRTVPRSSLQAPRDFTARPRTGPRNSFRYDAGGYDGPVYYGDGPAYYGGPGYSRGGVYGRSWGGGTGHYGPGRTGDRSFASPQVPLSRANVPAPRPGFSPPLTNTPRSAFDSPGRTYYGGSRHYGRGSDAVRGPLSTRTPLYHSSPRGSIGAPSRTFTAPRIGGAFGGGRSHYGAPSRSFGGPSSKSFGAPSRSYGGGRGGAAIGGGGFGRGGGGGRSFGGGARGGGGHR